MKKLMMLGGLCAVAFGCTVTKVEYSENEKGEKSYRIYRNDHWLKTDASGLRGGMTKDGTFEIAAEGMSSSPSEEFNRTMKTYGDTFVQLARLAAACYSPGTASIPLTSEAADANAVAKLVEAQAQAKASEIAAKSDKETAKLAAQTAAQTAIIAAKAAAATNAPTATATATCTDGSCTQK